MTDSNSGELIVQKLEKPDPKNPGIVPRGAEVAQTPSGLSVVRQGIVTNCTSLPKDILPASSNVKQTDSGLSIVYRSFNPEYPQGELSNKDKVPSTPSDEAQSHYLKGEVLEAFLTQLKKEEFGGNREVIELLKLTVNYLEEFNKTISDDRNPISPDKKNSLLIKALMEDCLDELDISEYPNLREKHQLFFQKIASISIETIEQLSIIATKLISHRRIYNQRLTEEILTALSFITTYKNKTERTLLLRDSSGIGDNVATIFENLPWSRMSEDNKNKTINLLLKIVDFIKFNDLDAERVLLTLTHLGFPLKHPVITRLAFQVETSNLKSEWVKDQEKKRQAFFEALKEAKRKGYERVFLSLTQDRQSFLEDFNRLSTEEEINKFLDTYFPDLDERKRVFFREKITNPEEKQKLLNDLLGYFGQAEALTKQIVFVTSPKNFSGKIGFERELVLITDENSAKNLFPLPKGFEFSLPASQGVYSIRNRRYLPIEIKPQKSTIKGKQGLTNIQNYCLWARRNSRIILKQYNSLHIHFDENDFPLYPDFLKKFSVMFEIKQNSLGTWETREWLMPYDDPATFLNRALIGALCQRWKKGEMDDNTEEYAVLFGLLSQMPTTFKLFEARYQWFFQDLKERLLINGEKVTYFLSILIQQAEENSEISKIYFKLINDLIKEDNFVRYVINNPNSDFTQRLLSHPKVALRLIENKEVFEYAINNPNSDFTRGLLGHLEVALRLIENEFALLDMYFLSRKNNTKIPEIFFRSNLASLNEVDLEILRRIFLCW